MLALVSALALAACGTHSHGEAGHGEHGHGEHGPEPAEDPRPDLSVTLYQGPLELFMEYPAFVVGAESPLIAHFTDTRDPEAFHPIVRGQITATLRFKDGSQEVFKAEKPLRDGIFKPIVKPTKAGEGTLTLSLTGDQVQGSVEVEGVIVHPNTQAAVAAEPEEAPTAEQPVPYLKEQQWKTQYATAPAETRPLRASVRVFGELRAAAGREVDLSAPVSGRVEVAGVLPRVGQAVKRGELFLTIAPAGGAGGADRSALELEERRARAELGLAEREHKRAQDLFASQAVAERQVDAARVAVEMAEARLRTATAQLGALRSVQSNQGGGRATAFDLRAPFDGVIARSTVMRGGFVAAGTPLLAIVDSSELSLVAHVPEQDLAAMADLDGAGFRVDGQAAERMVGMDQHLGLAPTLDPATRTAALSFAVDNAAGDLRPGQAARVTLYRKAATDGVAVPREAIVDDNGVPAVFVMDGGEGFFKRRIVLGARDGEFTGVLSGVQAGDRVVSRGAYEVKLSTTAGAIPAHGHQH
jgi:RND family efflux transporter MFP subunit